MAIVTLASRRYNINLSELILYQDPKISTRQCYLLFFNTSFRKIITHAKKQQLLPYVTL